MSFCIFNYLHHDLFNTTCMTLPTPFKDTAFGTKVTDSCVQVFTLLGTKSHKHLGALNKSIIKRLSDKRDVL